jgi:hypothetical protein
MRQIGATAIAQLDCLQVSPEPLAGVQLRGIGQQTLQVESISRPGAQERFDDVTTVNRGAIPDEQHAAGDLAEQMLQKGHDICGIDRAVLASAIELGLGRHGTDGREMIARPPPPQDRGLPYRGIRAHHTGQGIKARFVSKEDRLLRRLCPFLMVDQVSSRQWVMAAAWRWQARRAGFWGLQRRAWHTRLTWAGW